MLEVQHATVRYGDQVGVEDLSLTLPRGEVLAVLGPSGCGKSTLLRAVAGLEPVASGAIRWDGADLARTPTHKRGFALMFQDGQLFPGQSVARNVGYPLRLRHRDRRSTAGRVAELLELVGLADKGERLPGELSGGERQRVALARALAVDPRLLLLDEPLSALDRDLREALAVQLRDILTAAGTTALMVTHDQEEAFAVADRMAVLREGRLVQAGTVEEVWHAPADAWAARFLGYPTVLDGPAARVVRELLDPAATWSAVALRRSALQVTADGPIAGSVLAVRASTELTRLEVETATLGLVSAVSDPASAVRPGDRVRLSLDPKRMAPIDR